VARLNHEWRHQYSSHERKRMIERNPRFELKSSVMNSPSAGELTLMSAACGLERCTPQPPPNGTTGFSLRPDRWLGPWSRARRPWRASDGGRAQYAHPALAYAAHESHEIAMTAILASVPVGPGFPAGRPVARIGRT